MKRSAPAGSGRALPQDAAILRTWGAAVMRPHMIVRGGCVEARHDGQTGEAPPPLQTGSDFCSPPWKF